MTLHDMAAPRGAASLRAIGLLVLSVGLLACRGHWPIAVAPEAWDFGRVGSTSVLETQLTLTNRSGRSQTVTILSTCSCFTLDTRIIQLDPRKSCIVAVRYDPSQDNGAVRRQLLVRAEESGSTPILFTATGIVAGRAGIEENGCLPCLERKLELQQLIESNRRSGG